MDVNGPTARRFPLVARPRPTCGPLTRRVAEVVERADQAERENDVTKAASVFNLAALIASDSGLPDLARQWCHDHAAAHSRVSADARVARSALEPVVNLARLKIRAGQGQEAYELLNTLYSTVSNRTTADIDGIAVPADLARTAAEHREVCQWLWGVHLSDGTRALTSTGLWEAAYKHISDHKGIGQRLLDGRQVAIIAHFAAGDLSGASKLIDSTEPYEAWETAVVAYLRQLLVVEGHLSTNPGSDNLIRRYLALIPKASTAVFYVRLGLSIIDTVGVQGDSSAVATALTRFNIDHPDGYAARDQLSHCPYVTTLAADQRQYLHRTRRDCGLDSGSIPSQLRDDLESALEKAACIVGHRH